MTLATIAIGTYCRKFRLASLSGHLQLLHFPIRIVTRGLHIVYFETGVLLFRSGMSARL